MKKLYQASLDGGDSNDFHEKCDGVNFTISIIQSQGGKRFGGFTMKNWMLRPTRNPTLLSHTEDTDPEAFLFSLDRKEIYPVKVPEKAITSAETLLQCFGNTGRGDGILVDSYYLTKKTSFESKNDREESQNYNVPPGYVLTGDTNFSLKENEVYQIKFG